MLIKLADLSEGGLIINDTISLSKLNQRMAEDPDNDIIFTEEPRVELSIKGSLKGAKLRGSISSRYKQPCARCMDELEIPVESDLKVSLKPRSEDRPEECVDDVGVLFFDGEEVNLEDLLQEALILKLSPYYSPECDEAGNCVKCGKKAEVEQPLEEEAGTKLGDLLKNVNLN